MDVVKEFASLMLDDAVLYLVSLPTPETAEEAQGRLDAIMLLCEIEL